MKAFKKWFKNILPLVAPIPTKCNRSFIYCWSKRFKNASEKGWRAALKEVLKQISYAPDGSIVNWIEKELENE